MSYPLHLTPASGPRFIVGIFPDGVEDAQCIRVAHPSGMYLTDDFIPTHNSGVTSGRENKTLWRRARDWALQKLRRDYQKERKVSSRDGDEIIVAFRGFDHALNQGVPTLEKIAMALHIEEAIRSARRGETIPDRKERKDPYATTAYNTEATIDGIPYNVKILVRHHQDGTRYYDHFVVTRKSPPGRWGRSETDAASSPIPPSNSGLSISIDEIGIPINENARDDAPLFSTAADTPDAAPAPWDLPESGFLDDFIHKLQDKFVDLKRLVQTLEAAGKRIADAMNPYLQEALYHGRTAKQTADFSNKELKPLLNRMRIAGVSIRDLDEFLWMRHAPERNREIERIDPEMKDGSGVSTEDAEAYMKALAPRRRAILEAFARDVDAITKGTRELLVREGLATRETVDGWAKKYPNYAPLKREDMDDLMQGNGTGPGFSVRGPASKRAVGSRRKVVNVFSNLVMERERVITRAAKNRVSNALLGLAITNPNPDFWRVDQAPTERVVVPIPGAKREGPDLIDDDTPRREQVVRRVKPGFSQQPNVIFTKVGGKDHYIVFNPRNERAMRLAQALKNLDADSLGQALSLAAKGTRWFASVNTQYNPIFGIVNLIRDVQTAALNLESTPLKGKQVEVMKHVGAAAKGIFSALRGKPSGEWDALWEEFQNEGGPTGYRDMFANAEDRAERLRREMGDFGSGGKAKFDALSDTVRKSALMRWISDYNETLENAARLAAYRAAKDAGMSRAKAAMLAKELTVNFNRKGAATLQIGALYAFFNASAQGTARIAQTLFTNEGGKIGLSPAGRKIVSGGLLLGAMQALLLSAAGFGDDEPPDFVKEKNLVIPTGDGKYVTIPMPLGFHVIPNLSRISMEFALSGFEKPAQRAAQLLGVGAEAFNPIGNSGLSIQTLTPTIIDPLAALAENRDFTGRSIARRDFSSLDPTPGHARAKDTATPWAILASQALNYMSGGNEFRPGAFSPTPDQIDYLIGQLTGGVGREAGKAAQTVSAWATGEELPAHKIPGLGRFYGDATGTAAISNRFYDNVKEANLAWATIEGLRKQGRLAEARESLREHPISRLRLAASRSQSSINNMRALRKQMETHGAPREKIREMDERITQVMRRFNDLAERQEGAGGARRKLAR